MPLRSNATGTVSYTHLLLKALENAGLSEKDVNLVNMSTGDASNAFIAGPVSYTHLDVYKRQPYLCLSCLLCLHVFFSMEVTI